MEIKYLGHSSFRIKGKQATVVTDPFTQESVGISYQKLPADIVTISHEHNDHNAVEQILENPLIIRGPGEYEVKDVRIYGYKTFHDENNGELRGSNTIYLFVVDNIRILHCGDLGHALSSELQGEIGNVDILLIPTGGVFSIGPKQAANVTKQIEPLITIPMHYKVPGMLALYDEMQESEAFLKMLDKEPNIQDKVSVTKETLPVELEVITLTSK